MRPDRSLMAVYLDFENLALGFRGPHDRFDIGRVLDRLVEKGTLVVKRAYADWKRFATYAGALQEHAFELMQIPARRLTGKNSADMRLCVDVMDLCYSKTHIDCFVIVSGDSDFSPLVSKLRENGRTVIGLGMHDSTSALLRDNCDEFIYYEDLEAEQEVVIAELPEGDAKEQELYSLLLESLQALRRENREVLWASLVKETMKRKRPSFTEAYYGYRSFTELLGQAEKRGLLALERDASRRTHIVTAFGEEVNGPNRARRAAPARRGEEPRSERAAKHDQGPAADRNDKEPPAPRRKSVSRAPAARDDDEAPAKAGDVASGRRRRRNGGPASR